MNGSNPYVEAGNPRRSLNYAVSVNKKHILTLIDARSRSPRRCPYLTLAKKRASEFSFRLLDMKYVRNANACCVLSKLYDLFICTLSSWCVSD